MTAASGRQGPRRRSGFWIHRCKLLPEDRTARAGIPVTSVARTLFDYAEVEPIRRLEPVRNVHVLGREVDALWPEGKLVVELALLSLNAPAAGP